MDWTCYRYVGESSENWNIRLYEMTTLFGQQGGHFINAKHLHFIKEQSRGIWPLSLSFPFGSLNSVHFGVYPRIPVSILCLYISHSFSQSSVKEIKSRTSLRPSSACATRKFCTWSELPTDSDGSSYDGGDGQRTGNWKQRPLPRFFLQTGATGPAMWSLCC